MTTEKKWITEHFEVGTISAGHSIAQVLACRYCGAFVWDTEKHISVLHPVLLGGGRRFDS